MCAIASRTVKTRKPHRCWGCTVEIPGGTLTDITISVDDGRIATSYWCDICSGILNERRSDFENGLCYGDLQEEAEERRAGG